MFCLWTKDTNCNFSRHDFLVLHFCVANFKSRIFTSGVNFCGKNVCGNFYLRKLILASARNLGTWFDTHLDMGTHITKTCSSAFYYLYNIRHIRKYLSRESTEKLVHAFISSRLDYCNSLLYGIPEYQTRKLQRVMNASARLIYRAHKFCHITPLLAELHWLPVCSRIHYKILLITFKILHGL